MAITSTGNIAEAKSKQNKASTEGDGARGLINNGLKKSSLLYVPRQVLMNWSTDIKTPASDSSKADIKISRTAPSSSSKMNSKMLNTENPKSTIDIQNWSPLVDAIVTRIPRSLIANCSLSNGTAEPKDSKKPNIGLAMKAVNEYIDKVLYGPGKSSLPVFEKIRSE